MQAVVLDEFGGGFRVEQRVVPEPSDGQVLVEVRAVGAGLTLERARMGVMGGSTPRVLGHEFSGTVARLGPGAAGWGLGDPVTASFYLFCGRCEWCTSGRETLCDRLAGYIGVAVDGAFAEYVAVPAQNLVPIPDGVPLEEAGVVADAVATPYHVVTRRLPVVAGQWTAVVGGGGGLGVHMLQMLRAFGASVIAVERSGEKAAELERLGLADVVIQPDGDDWVEEVRVASGDRLVGIVDTVGAVETLAPAVAALGTSGTLVVLGYRPGSTVTVEANRLLFKEMVVTGTRYATRAEIAKSLELVRQGRVRPLIGARFRLSQLESAFSAIRGNEVFGRILIDPMDQ